MFLHPEEKGAFFGERGRGSWVEARVLFSEENGLDVR